MDTENKEKLMGLIREAVEQDKLLRDQFEIGDKFRFVRDRLQALLAYAEENLKVEQVNVKKVVEVANDNEVLAYIYLFNAQGIVVNTWLKMLKPEVFYEHSVNRPIYTEKAHIEGLIKRKPTIVQHAYITLVINKSDILQTEEAVGLQDSYGNLVVKVKEGCLRFDKMVSFTHNDQEYEVNTEGELVKKTTRL